MTPAPRRRVRPGSGRALARHAVHRRRVSKLVACLAAFFCLAPSAPASAQTGGAVQGRVVSAATGAPLPGAAVEARLADRSRTVITDPSGHFLLDSLSTGLTQLRVSHIGYAPFELEAVLPPGRPVRVDVALEVRPVPLRPVSIITRPGGRLGRENGRGSDPELARVSTRALRDAPDLAGTGLVDALRGGPGSDPDPGRMLYIRGAAADLKLVFLDGAPVYAPFPLGGLLEPFAVGMLDRANVYLGGAPAQYDGGLSYMMDLRTRAADERGMRTSGAADLISVHALAEASAGEQGGAILSARGIHPLASGGLLGDGLPYDYQEVLGRGDLGIGSRARLSLTAFRNREAVQVGDDLAGDGAIQWGNDAASLRLHGVLGRTAAAANLAVGRYTAALPVPGAGGTRAHGATDRTRLTLDLSRTAGDLQIRYGLSFDDQSHRAEAFSAASGASQRTLSDRGRVAGLYAEASAQPHRRVRVRGGARVDHFSAGSQLVFAPRMALTWMVTEQAAITFAGGRYHQFLRPPHELVLAAATSGSVTAFSPTLLVGSADHFTVALDQHLADGLRLGVDGYFKRFSHGLAARAAPTPGARASGLDLWVLNQGDALEGWLGYSLSWVWTHSSEAPSSSFAGRHLLSTGLAAPLGERTRFEARLDYGAGLPYTGISLTDGPHPNFPTAGQAYASPPGSIGDAARGGIESAPLLHTPDRPFLRLTAGLSQRWHPRRGDRTFEIEPYLRVLNSLGQRDALFYYLDPAAEAGLQPIGNLPLIPVAGLRWSF